jgi:LPXTG-motif cell wall-anchored protein
VRTQEIFLRNDSSQFVDFFLKINPVKGEDEALLRQMTLVISEEGEEIFRESLDQQGSFENYVKIKELLPESEFRWDLSLEVSEEMGNEFMGKEAEVEWVIMIEEIEDEDVDPLPLPEEPEEPEEEEELPKTGEETENYLLYGGGLLALGILVLFLDRKRKRASN